MQRQLQGILYYLATDIRYAFTIFWMIIGSFLLLSLMINLIIGNENSVVHFTFSFPIYIFSAAAGFITVKNTIPYLVKMGATRKVIYISTVIFFIGLALVNSLIANGLDFLIKQILKSDVSSGIFLIEGEKTIQFNHIADILGGNNYLYQIIVDTSISFFFLTVLFIIGLVFYRFGLIGGFSFVGIVIFSIIFGLANGWIIDFLLHISTDFSIVFFYQLAFVGFVIYLFSYLLLRRLTI